MKYRQIETSREIRLWVTGIILPAIVGAATIFASDPELFNDAKNYVRQKVKNLKNTGGKETL
jgi:hypothetical protein